MVRKSEESCRVYVANYARHKPIRHVRQSLRCTAALKLSQEEFAASFHIPIGTLRDWEQGQKEPDAAARAYLRVIAREPEVVRRALERPT